MKHKILAILAITFLGIMCLAAPASATNGDNGDKPSADNKMVTLCHATGSESNPYTKITISVKAFYQAGHIDHQGDIWDAFTYTTVGGETVTVPQRGDVSLLAFPDCQQPKVDEKIAKPDVVYNDACGTKDDVFSVPDGRGYTVSPITTNNGQQSITVSLEDGFVWADGSHDDIVFTRPAFTNVDCGLPDTGGHATYATSAGIGAGIGAILVGSLLFMTRRRTN